MGKIPSMTGADYVDSFLMPVWVAGMMIALR
jgi:hypothetical protein